jgi:hypothetical protein
MFVIAALTLALGCRHPEDSRKSPQPKASPPLYPTPSVITSDTPWNTVEEFDYAWRESRPPVHFKLQLPEGYRAPGDFTRVRIQAPGRREFVLDNQDGWIEYNSTEQPSTVYAGLQKRNLVKSKYVLVLPGSRSQGEPPLVFLRSWGYASDAERLHVIGFQPSGEPITLINAELDLIELADLDDEGNLHIVGRPCLSQEFGPGLLTYDPIHVYTLPHPVTSPATLSLPLSEAYNLKHYYGWAGPDCSEKLAVVLHPPSGGKPIIMKVDAAEKLMEGAK